MANQAVQNYLNDEGVDYNKRLGVINAIKAGQSPDEIGNMISQKYGSKYSTGVSPTPISQPATASDKISQPATTSDKIGNVIAGGLKALNPANLGSTISGAEQAFGQAAPKIGQALGAIGQTSGDTPEAAAAGQAASQQREAANQAQVNQRASDVQSVNKAGIVPNSTDTNAQVQQGAENVKGYQDTQNLGQNLLVGGAKQIGQDVLGAGELGARAEQAVTQPIQDAIRPAVQSVTEPAVSQLGQAPNVHQMFSNMDALKDQVTKADNPQQEAGKIITNLAEFLLPGGAIADAGKAVEGADVLANAPKIVQQGAGLATRAGLEGATSGAITAANEGDVNQNVATSAAIGAAAPIAVEAIKGLGSVAGEVAKHLTSGYSSVPVAAIEHAISDPVAVQSAIKRAVAQGGDATAQQIYNDTMEGLDSLKTARSNEYVSNLQKAEDSFVTMKNGNTYVRNAEGVLEPVNLTTKGVKDTFTKTLKDFGAQAKAGNLDFSEVAIDNSHANKLQQLSDRVYGWKDNTPTGLNKLRQVIDSYAENGVNPSSSGKRFDAIINNISDNLSKYVGKNVPGIEDMNAKFASQSRVIEDIQNQLKTESKDPNTALRKLLNVFNPKSTVYRPIVEALGQKSGKDLMSDIAGLAMSKWTPDGLGKYLSNVTTTAATGASLINPALWPVAAASVAGSSPRVVGGVATGIGKLAQSEAPGIIGNIAKAGLKTAAAQN